MAELYLTATTNVYNCIINKAAIFNKH